MAVRFRHLPVKVPDDATDVVVEGPRPFVTDVRYLLPDGRRVHWEARRNRKEAGGRGVRGLTWWIGLLFVIGSACFVAGPLPFYVSLVGTRGAAVTFFIGSLFFTTAAYLSYIQVIRQAGHRWFGWAPHLMGFWATTIQLIGTVYFNATTYRALLDVPPEMVNQVIWRPDVFGSICFLVSSAIAFGEAGHRWWSWRPGHRDWHVTALNMWGSVFFGLSAIGAYTEPSGSLRNAVVANVGTGMGALCFLASAAITMREGAPPKS